MFIRKIKRDNSVEPVEAVLTTINGNRHYNIKYNVSDESTFGVSIGVVDTLYEDALFNKERTVTLFGSSFSLIPIKRGKESVKDVRGLPVYFVGNTENKEGVYCLFEPPFHHIEAMTYTFTSGCKELTNISVYIENDAYDLPLLLMRPGSSIEFSASVSGEIVTKKITLLRDDAFHIEVSKDTIGG